MLKKKKVQTKITISNLFDLSTIIHGNNVSLDEKEQVICDVKIKNKGGYEKPCYLIRHKSSKDKWLVKTNNNFVVCTADHSLMILENNEFIEKTPTSVNIGDIVLENEIPVEITYIKNIGSFDNEWVYDVEMNNNKTFYANDILVHNTDSVYFSIEDLVDDLTSRKLLPEKYENDITELILDITELRLNDYIEQAYEAFAKKYKTANGQKFELENVLDNAILLAKKKYVGSIAWKEGDGKVAKGKKLKITGVEIVQSSTPKFCREKLKYLIQYIFDNVDNFDVSKFIGELKKIKREFESKVDPVSIEEICYSKSIGDYEKFILEDKHEFKIASGCPIHVRGGGYHNYLLNTSEKYKNKYKRIKTTDKVKMYYSDDNECNAFCYLSGNFPYEIAPPINLELQFEKSIIDPINRLMIPLGVGPLSPNLVSSRPLF